MCYFLCNAQKIIISRGFNLISNSWLNSRWRPRWRQLLVRPQGAPAPMKYTSGLVKKIKGFPVKVKSFLNTATYQKLRGGLPSTPPPLYHGGGI